MKKTKRIFGVLLAAAMILTAIFLAGRYGWRLGGFHACQSADITSIEVCEQGVRITGSYPGLFSKGFCGYYSQEKDGKLYVGFRFDAVFGFFETGNFDITIPVSEVIDEVIIKTHRSETTLWTAQLGATSHSESR